MFVEFTLALMLLMGYSGHQDGKDHKLAEQKPGMEKLFGD